MIFPTTGSTSGTAKGRWGRSINSLWMSSCQSIIWATSRPELHLEDGWSSLETVEEGEEITIDTVPNRNMNGKMGKAIEAFTLSEVVNLMLDQEEQTTSTLHSNLPWWWVQVQGDWRLPSSGSQSKGKVLSSAYSCNLLGEEGELGRLEDCSTPAQWGVSSVTTGVSLEAFWEKVDFVMGDGTAHNIGVMEIVSKKLEMEHTLGHLLCQFHPALMFNRVLVSIWKQVWIFSLHFK